MSNKKKEYVITSNGSEAKRSDCRKIDGVYYLLGKVNVKDSGQCYPITDSEGKIVYYRSTNPKLIWDCELEQYVIKTNQINGIVDYLPKEGKFELGYFTPNVYRNIDFRQYSDNHGYGSIINCIDESVPKKAGLVYNPFEYGWCKPNQMRQIKDSIIIAVDEGYRKNNYNGFQEHYNSSEHNMFGIMQETYDKYIVKKPTSPFDKYFNEQTIGIEIETSGGNIPKPDLFKYGLMPLKDGSIVGHEFTTTIIKNKYFETLKGIFDSVSKNTATNQNCSLHYHFGNVKKGKEFVVALWFLYSRMEANLETFCPPYKRNLSYLSNKRLTSGSGRGAKDHCKRLPCLFSEFKATNTSEIQSAFDNILRFLNQGRSPECVSSKELLYRHVSEGRPKWDYEARYYVINLIPFLFERKQTIEFRFHSGTVNFYKAFAWALMCSAILQYAELNIEKILEGKEKIRIIDIINIFRDGSPEGNFISEWLNEYYINRSVRYQTLYVVNDLFGKEFQNDNSFEFKNKNGVCPLTFKL